MLVLVLVLAVVALVLLLLWRLGSNEDPVDRILSSSDLAPPVGEPTSAPAARPTDPLDDRPSTPPPAARPSPSPTGKPTLSKLLEKVTFPDDLLPLTHGMSAADIDWRLVLVTRSRPSEVHHHLDEQLNAAGFVVRWDGVTQGTALRDDGEVMVTLHPPVSEEEAARLAQLDAPKRRRKNPHVVPGRPDFPSAPLDATVVELAVR